MNTDELGENNQEEELIDGHYCICNLGTRTLGCCSHLDPNYGTWDIRDMNLKFGTLRFTFFIACLNYNRTVLI